MSPTNPGHTVMKNSNIDQTMFLLEIVGGVVFILLVLLCVLLHFCRRKCLNPCQLFKKLRLSSTLRSAKKDQSTSTSRLNLEVSQSESEWSVGNRHPEPSGHKEVVIVDVHVNEGCSVGEEDLLQHTNSTSQESSLGEELLSHSHMSSESMKSLEKTERCGSPDKEDHIQSFSARSSFEKEEEAKFQVDLSSPHSQQQMQPQHLATQAVSQQHLQEAGTDDWKPQHVVMSESVSLPASFSDEFIKEGLTEVGRGKPLPHPQTWFVTLDGHSNTVRHSYIDLKRDGSNRINNISLDYGNEINKSKEKGQMNPQKDLDEVNQSGSECGTSICSPEDNTPRCELEGGSRRRQGGQLPSLNEETMKESVESSSKPLTSTECKITGDHEADQDDNDGDDGNNQREGKKSPWQKREERPVMIFNLK